MAEQPMVGADATASTVTSAVVPTQDPHTEPAPSVDEQAVELSAALDAARSGDSAAFAVLYRDTHPRLIRYAASLVGTDAEDVTSEAWFQIARDIPALRGDLDGFRAWAARIVRNRAIDHARSRNRHPQQPLDDMLTERLAADEDTFTSVADSVSTRSALALVASLPQDQAEAVMLRVVLGLDAARAGEVLGKSAGAVRVAAHRGLRSLAKRLERTEEANE